MSTDWDVHCLDCNDSLKFDGTKNSVLTLISDGPTLEELHDEYGHFDDECGVHFQCGHCEVQSLCKRPRRHGGDQ